ncbi:ras-domain-containing protein [Testicularia cyperi]|uniref:Ras-domain-containing protein n=1 Tax=Testicularia cyperi TaxID=1882483 RepID=A0A317XZZ3_9BASI|nr:ras-domain-containing protein [Testicularia cyperi]
MQTQPSFPRQRPTHVQNSSNTTFSSAVAAAPSSRTLDSISSCTSMKPIAPKRAIKVVLIGDGGSGKTSMRNHFLTGTFSPSYRATIGADFITKTLPVDPSRPDGEKATLQIWDTAGQERFQSLGSAFYRGADAVIITMDLTKAQLVPGTGSVSSLERIKTWYDAFMDKAPGPSNEDDRKRFCWICAANKVDVVDKYRLPKVERSKIRDILDSLVPSPAEQPDWGIDDGQHGKRPSGAEEPADPAEVLSRPDPNSSPSASPLTPTKARSAHMADLHPMEAMSLGDSAKDKSAKMAAATVSANGATTEMTRQLSNASTAAQSKVGGTIKTLYETPFQTLSGAPQVVTSPAATEQPNRNSGFLSSFMNASSIKGRMGIRDQSFHARGRGHQKRQSIKSIEVFQPANEDDDVNTGVRSANSFAFPQSAQTPPRKTSAAMGSSMVAPRDRQRVDSTMSLGAPSIYHTPRSSTMFSASPTPQTALGLAANAESVEETEPMPALTHRLSSTSSAATATNDNRPLRAPKSINDLFQPGFKEPATPKPSRAADSTASTISSLPVPENPVSELPADIEQGFTLFYTSAKTGHNLERMFQHIVTRVVASETFAQQSLESQQDADEQERIRLQHENTIRRTIRLASGKNPDRKWGCC